MGLFNKLKNILFEDDEVEEMPVYTKKNEEEKVVPKASKSQVEVHEEIKKEVEIKPVENTRFRGIKRDIDVSYDDVLEEVPSAPVGVRTPEKMEIPKEVEKKSPFLSFDEEEFERLNSHIVHNENKNKVQPKRSDMIDAGRRANSNFSPITTTRETNRTNPDKYKIENTGIKKPFTPSPVISPVYGILDKNYKKDDIVDKKDGMKREIIRPVVHVEKPIVHDEVSFEVKENKEMGIDEVRNKAYGIHEEVEKKNIEDKIEYVQDEVSDNDLPEPNVTYNDFNYKSESDDLDEIVANHFDEIDAETEDVHKVEDYENTKSEKAHAMDDMERTSTLQILDDIEKELNAIKPISKVSDQSVEDNDEKSDDTLENDLFNLIDSMYEKGEEEDDA